MHISSYLIYGKLYSTYSLTTQTVVEVFHGHTKSGNPTKVSLNDDHFELLALRSESAISAQREVLEILKSEERFQTWISKLMHIDSINWASSPVMTLWGHKITGNGFLEPHELDYWPLVETDIPYDLDNVPLALNLQSEEQMLSRHTYYSGTRLVQEPFRWLTRPDGEEDAHLRP